MEALITQIAANFKKKHEFYCLKMFQTLEYKTFYV